MRTMGADDAGGRSKPIFTSSAMSAGSNSKYNGAYHASEILYVFSNLNPKKQAAFRCDFKLSEMMTSMGKLCTTGDLTDGTFQMGAI